MSTLLVAIPVWTGDYEQVLRNLRDQFERDGKCRHHAIVAYDTSLLSTGEHQRVDVAAQQCFASVESFLYSKTDRTVWPAPHNYAWQQIAWRVETCHHAHVTDHVSCPSRFDDCKGWFLWESDALPLKKGWLDTLADAYAKGRKPFMGHIVPKRGHMNAVAIYPFDISTHCTKAMLVKQAPFDVVLSGEIGLKNITPANHLIAHHLKVHGGDPAKPITKAVLDSLPASTVLIHGYVMADLSKEPTPEPKGEWPPDYSISILCFNNLELTKRCVESVLRHSNNCELLLTDNGSTDGTHEYLKSLASEDGRLIRIITNRENLGFNRPSNHAASIANGRFFVMLNNDTEVCRGWLSALRKSLTPSVGIVGVSGTCSALSDECIGCPGKLEYVEASCCMMRSGVAKEFGPFSEYLKFAYCEDADLSLRLAEAGYAIKAIALPIKHTRAATSSKIPELARIKESNRREMVKRWGFYLKRRTFDRKVLIRRRGAHGDVLFLTPIIRELRTKWPKAEISVDTACPEILLGQPVTAGAGQDAAKFDTVFNLDLAYEKVPKTHAVDAYSRACDMIPKSRTLTFKGATPSDLEWAVNHATQKPLLLLHAGPTGWPGRDWPIERFAELATKMSSHGWHVATVGTVRNLLVERTADLRGTTLGQLYALISRCSLFIGIDSLPFNLAQAAGVRAVGLFGTINPAYRLCSDNAIAVHATKAQARCLFAHHDLPPPITKSSCNGECMKAITVQSVLEAIGK